MHKKVLDQREHSLYFKINKENSLVHIFHGHKSSSYNTFWQTVYYVKLQKETFSKDDLVI